MHRPARPDAPAGPDPRRIGADLAEERFGRLLDRLPPQLREAFDLVVRRLGPWTGLLITLAIGIVVVALAVDAFEDTWEWVRESTGTDSIDHTIHDGMVAARTGAMTVAMTVVTELAGKIGMPIVALVLAAALAFAARSWRPLVLVTITGLGSLLLTSLSKTASGRDRPPQADALPPFETSPSFPSGHTLNATAILLIVAYCCLLQFDRLATRIIAVAAAVAFIVAVALSRVYLGHHWASDVAGALSLGVAWSAVVVRGHRVFSIVRTRRRERARESAGDAGEAGSP